MVSMTWALLCSLSLANASTETLIKWQNIRVARVSSGTGALEITESGSADFFRTESIRLVRFIQLSILSNIPKSLNEKFLSLPITIYLRSPWKGPDGIYIDPLDEEIGQNLLGNNFAKDTSTIIISPQLFSSSDYYRLISHELFHAFQHALNPGNPGWVREGLAQVFESKIVGSLNTTVINTMIDDTSTSLIGDYNIAVTSRPLYAHHALFFHYLDQKCASNNQDGKVEGDETFFWDLTITPVKGWNSIITNYCPIQDINVLAINFELARLINRTQITRDGEMDLTYSLEQSGNIHIKWIDSFMSSYYTDHNLLPWAPILLGPADPNLQNILSYQKNISDLKIYYYQKDGLTIHLTENTPRENLQITGLILLRASSLLESAP